MEASTRQSDQIAVFDVVKKTKCLGEIRHALVGCLSSIVNKLILIQQCSDKVEAIEVLDCTKKYQKKTNKPPKDLNSTLKKTRNKAQKKQKMNMKQTNKIILKISKIPFKKTAEKGPEKRTS